MAVHIPDEFKLTDFIEYFSRENVKKKDWESQVQLLEYFQKKFQRYESLV